MNAFLCRKIKIKKNIYVSALATPPRERGLPITPLKKKIRVNRHEKKPLVFFFKVPREREDYPLHPTAKKVWVHTMDFFFAPYNFFFTMPKERERVIHCTPLQKKVWVHTKWVVIE